MMMFLGVNTDIIDVGDGVLDVKGGVLDVGLRLCGAVGG